MLISFYHVIKQNWWHLQHSYMCSTGNERGDQPSINIQVNDLTYQAL